MKRLSKVLIVVVLLNVLAPLPAVMAQQLSASASSDTLREQIARLESIERDPETSAEVRELNRDFLLARRAQLRAALKKRVNALETYLSSGAGILSSSEADAVSTSIRNLKAELQSLGGEAPSKDSTVAEVIPAILDAGGTVPQDAKEAEEKRRREAKIAAGVFEDTTAPPDITCEKPLSDGDDVTYTVAYKLKDDDKHSWRAYIVSNKNSIPETALATVFDNTLYSTGGSPQKEDYAVVHIIEWGTAAPEQGKFEAIRERWTLYKFDGNAWKKQSAQQGTRIYGQRRVHVLAIHLRARDTWDIDYTVSVKKKTPTNVANALDLLSIITSGKVAKAVGDAKPEEQDRWGGGLMCINALPSDIEVQAEVVVRAVDGTALQQPKTYNKTYDNEGKYWWDVSFGVPFKEVKEVQFNSDGGTVTAKEVTRQNAYGFLNIFFQKQDLTGDSFLNTPHLVLGVPISKKPLDRPVVGLGYGIRKFSVKFDFYAGVVFNRVREPRTLNTGDPATQGQLEADFQTKRVRKFIFGVNLPLRQVKEALTGDN